jgi:hypothetical protein
MQPPPRPRARWTTSAKEHLRDALGNQRTRLLLALNAILYELPRVAHRWRTNRIQQYANAFHYWHDFVTDGQIWRLDCVVADAGWPTELWVWDVFGSERGTVG